MARALTCYKVARTTGSGLTMAQDNKIDHMKWQVKWRSKNQECSLSLFELLNRHPKRWQQDAYYDAALQMSGAAFSLWRAVFLADKEKRTREAVLQHSMDFLEAVILDNAISYLQDKKTNEWTFNYYVGNARLRLIKLSNDWHKLGVVPEWESKTRPPKSRWVYAHEFLCEAIEGFEQRMKNWPKNSKSSQPEEVSQIGERS